VVFGFPQAIIIVAQIYDKFSMRRFLTFHEPSFTLVARIYDEPSMTWFLTFHEPSLIMVA